MLSIDKYQLVVGLEVHAQLSTQSKAFSADPAAYGGQPNTHVSAISVALPGTLPRINKKAIEYAVKFGLAVDSRINLTNTFARKNYFYADLPKGYQISQDTAPVCVGGSVTVHLKNNRERQIAIHHIHMEEDAGKSMHDQHDQYSYIDLNRAGVPLLEIVSEPDMHSAEEAHLYLTEVRRLLRYLEICDGNMEEGSMRCDANISVRLKGDQKLGNRCEVKNLNSIRNVQRAIEHEFLRQVNLIEAGGTVEQNTLNFDAETGETSVLRSKEMANDYRYFPDPDLPPVVLTESYVEQIRQAMPPLPKALFAKYTGELQLTAYDAAVLTAERETAEYFEQVIKHTANYKAAANWIMGPVRSHLNETGGSIATLALKAEVLAQMIALVDAGQINHSAAAHKLFPALLRSSGKSAADMAAELNILVDTAGGPDVAVFIRETLASHPDKVKEYHKGKKGVLGLFMGEIMKKSKGKIDPKKANELLIEVLESSK